MVGRTMSKTNKSELEKLQVRKRQLFVLFLPGLLLSSPSQEAFYNFDEEKTGYLSIDDLRYIVTTGAWAVFRRKRWRELGEAAELLALAWSNKREEAFVAVLTFFSLADGNPLAGQDLEDFLAEADIFKNGVVDYKAFAQLLLSEDN